MTPLLEATGLVVTAGGRRILDDVSLTLRARETVAIVGPNGAGKSTLLRALSGELRPLRGSVRLSGRDISAYTPMTLARHRAVLSQNISVAFPFTVAEVVAMGAGDRRGTAIDQLVVAALDEVDLQTFAERVFPTLSGGEQKRAHFARVLVQMACADAVNGRGVLLLDEPTASLDLRHQLTLTASALRRAQRGAAVLAIMHDLNLAAVLADRIVVLDGGRIVRQGKPVEVITDALLEQVFGVRSAVNLRPPPQMPFVLPHGAEAIA